MTKVPAAILLAALSSAVILAQTSSTTSAKKPVHHTTTTPSRANATATAANPADNPPNVPKVAGTPKPLYALRYVDTVIGTGELAVPRKWYSVRYTGWLTDGTKFDSSDDHPGKQPIAFPYGAHRVIPGWDTGFEGMHVGGKRRLYIPYQLAYGEAGRTGIPPKAALIFDLELVSLSDDDPSAAPPLPTSQPPDTGKPATQPVDPTKPTSTSPTPSSNPTAAPNASSLPK